MSQTAKRKALDSPPHRLTHEAEVGSMKRDKRAWKQMAHLITSLADVEENYEHDTSTNSPAPDQSDHPNPDPAPADVCRTTGHVDGGITGERDPAGGS